MRVARKSMSLLRCFGMLLVALTLNAANAEQQVTSGDASRDWLDAVDPAQFAEQPIVDEGGNLSELRAIASNIQSLKSDVIDLNKDLRKMEEKLLFPSNTRYTVFVSLTTGQFFSLEGVKLKMDGKLVASHVYSDKQRAALSRGGVHKLYVTNLNEGIHSITAFFTGQSPDGRPYKRAANLEFEKSIGSEFLELAIVDDGSTLEPIFTLNRW